jgi:AAA domain
MLYARTEFDLFTEEVFAPNAQGIQDWLGNTADAAGLLSRCRELTPLFWHGEPDPRPRRKWRIKNLMPAVGAGLLSGQWGTYKTFMAIEMATTVIAADRQFCGRQLIEPCSVLILATEGAFELRDRIDAAIRDKHPDLAQAPISWRESCPTLLADNASEQLIQIIREATEGSEARFGLPLGLVIIDVLTDAAGYAKAGDENDPAVGAKLMGVLRRAAEACSCFVLAVDHFGKSIEAGTRGTSAKEGAADLILACLGEREVEGSVKNSRLALRKVRGGPQGQSFPYNARVVSVLEPTEDGEETTCVIDWEANATVSADDPWKGAARRTDAKLALDALRRAMMSLLAEYGVEKELEPEAPAILMIDQERVREEFCANTTAEGATPKQKQKVKQQRFRRALDKAEEQGLIGRRDIEGVTYLWFTAEG